MIGEEHGQSEFYTALIPMVPDLMSCIDTSGMMEDLIVKNEAHANNLVVQMAELARQQSELTRQQAALSTKNDQLRRRLVARARESGDRHHSSTIEEDIGESMAASGKKRRKT